MLQRSGSQYLAVGSDNPFKKFERLDGKPEMLYHIYLY